MGKATSAHDVKRTGQGGRAGRGHRPQHAGKEMSGTWEALCSLPGREAGGNNPSRGGVAEGVQGVRSVTVAMKPGNAGGAKGRRSRSGLWGHMAQALY